MHIEFKSPTWTAPDWILEDDKIILKKRLGKDQEYYFADIESIGHSPEPKGYVKYPQISFSANGRFIATLLYSNDEPIKSQGAEAVSYIKSKMAEAKLKKETEKKEQNERIFNEKIASYKKEKTKVVDEKLEPYKEKYLSYIGNYLMSLPKDGEFIISGATIDQIANSCNELRDFKTTDDANFKRLVEYLCNNKILIKKESLIDQVTYRLASSLEKEGQLDDSKTKIAAFACMLGKKDEYIAGCNRDAVLLKLYNEYSKAYSNFVSSALATPLHYKKPMSATSAAVLGTVVGGATVGALAAIGAAKKMEQYVENERNCISSNIATASAQDKAEYYFYKVQSVLYEYDDVYTDWLKSKKNALNSLL